MTDEKTPDVPELDLDTFVNEYGQEPVAPAPVETPPVEPAPEPAPAAPDFKSELDALKSGYEEQEKHYQEIIDQQNSRMQTLETLVNQGYQRAHAEPPKPEIPTFTPEELQNDPVGTIERMSDVKAKAAIEANNQQLSNVIGGLVERSWQGELSALRTKPYFKEAEAEIDALVQQNPSMKLTPNSAALAYNMIIGRKLDAGELKPITGPTLVPPTTPAVPSTPRTPVPVPAPGGPPSPVPPEGSPPKKEPELTARQKELQKRFASLEVGLTANDFEGE
jgi:hypothetical protein